MTKEHYSIEDAVCLIRSEQNRREQVREDIITVLEFIPVMLQKDSAGTGQDAFRPGAYKTASALQRLLCWWKDGR